MRGAAAPLRPVSGLRARLVASSSFAVELERLELLAQRAAIDPEDLRRFALIAVRVRKHVLKERLFDFANDEVIQVARLMSVQVCEVAVQRLVRKARERLISHVDMDGGGGRLLGFLACRLLRAGCNHYNVLP